MSKLLICLNHSLVVKTMLNNSKKFACERLNEHCSLNAPEAFYESVIMKLILRILSSSVEQLVSLLKNVIEPFRGDGTVSGTNLVHKAYV